MTCPYMVVCTQHTNKKERITSIADANDNEEFRRTELLNIIRDIYSNGRSGTFMNGDIRMRYIAKIETLCGL
jgi:hypothetical protein